jgi:hypothetical protein
LGARKIQNWLLSQGQSVEYFDGDPGFFLQTSPDKVFLSVIFSWDAPLALLLVKRFASADIECGGPGMFALSSWWKKVAPHVPLSRGIDNRFERQSGTYRMTFASRGCPVNCSFCIVPRLEGIDFTLDWDFTPAPILCDNNLSALPVDFQAHILRRYRETNTKLADANSGFEPITFDEYTYMRWREQLKGVWRFAFDTSSEEPQVYRMMQILKEVNKKKKQVYVLIGNEDVESCFARAQKVIEWGGEPYVQPVMPLNALSRDDLKVNFDWTFKKLKDMQRFYNRHLYHAFPIQKYKPRINESEPFAAL